MPKSKETCRIHKIILDKRNLMWYSIKVACDERTETGARCHSAKSFEIDREMLLPNVLASPQEAFYAEKERLPIKQTAGRISGEFVMAYPPGIPILAPGEEITKDIIDYILYSVEKGCSMQGMEDSKLEYLNVLKL